MATVQAPGEEIRKAMKWIAEERTVSPEKKKLQLINEACVKFNLSPSEGEYLFRYVK